MVSDSELAGSLREFLSTSDLTTTTTAIIRRKLEEEFGIDLTDKKAFIREQVDLYLERQQQNDEGNKENGDEEREAKDEVVEEELEEPEEASNGKSGGRSKRRSKKQNKEVKKRGGGLSKLCPLSEQLQKLMGVPELARTEVVRKLWRYIREHELQDPANRRNIRCYGPFRELFGVDSIDMFQMNKVLKDHIKSTVSDAAQVSSAPKEKRRKKEREEALVSLAAKEKQRKKGREKAPVSSTPKGQQCKKEKEEAPVNPEPKEKRRKKERDVPDEQKSKKWQKGAGGSGSHAPIPLSDALVKFLGTGENALARSDVVKQMCDYFKQNNLQDPYDRRIILCDKKLKELLDVNNFNGLTVSKLLKTHFEKT